MAYNPQMYYPQTYPQTYQPYYPQQPQGRFVEVVPVDTEESAESFPVPVGQTQILMAKDDSFIAVKSIGVSGQSEFNVFVKRKPVPKPVFDPSMYVTKEELETRLHALTERKEDE